MSNTAMTYHYAVNWPLGRMSYSSGRPARHVYRFASAAARDAWVADGNPYTSGPHYRESVRRREVEAEIRRAARRHELEFPSCPSPWTWDGEDGRDVLLS